MSDFITRLADIRKDFPILSREVYGKPLVYFDNGATTQKPKVVLNTIEKFYNSINANIHRGVHKLSAESTEEYEKAREVAIFLRAFDCWDGGEIVVVACHRSAPTGRSRS